MGNFRVRDKLRKPQSGKVICSDADHLYTIAAR